MTRAANLNLTIIQAAIRQRLHHRFWDYYPDTGPLRRDLYPKHIAFFAAGAQHRERLFIAGNRVGKTEGVNAYEVAVHLTGLYPVWWVGRRFNDPIRAWAVGDRNQTTRDILQAKLLGRTARMPGDNVRTLVGQGTGMIPADCILGTRPKAGLAGAIEVAHIQHVSGGRSILTFKSYEQGPAAFQGTEQHVISLDEEPPLDVYLECLTRTMRTGSFAGGIVILTFTPLGGWTEVVDQFLNETKRIESGRFHIQAGWDDAPHLSAAEREDMLRRYPEYQRDARSKGVPQLGVGAIYQIAESSFVVPPRVFPSHFPRAYGLDVGWNRTACVWAARDNDTGTIYLYDEHYYAHADVAENSRAIKERGAWIPGVIDPGARGRSQNDGLQTLQNYRDQGLNVTPAVNTREAGIQLVRDLLLEGKLKVCSNLKNWLTEFRLYRREKDGKVVKENDHLMDATRYLIVSGRDRMIVKPRPRPGILDEGPAYRGEGGWMRRS